MSERTDHGWSSVPNWVIRSDKLHGSEKLLYIALLNRANSKGECWPSLATLENDSGVTRKTVLKKLRGLEEKGLIRRIKRKAPDGRDLSNVYKILPFREGVINTPMGVNEHQGRAGLGVGGGMARVSYFYQSINVVVVSVGRVRLSRVSSSGVRLPIQLLHCRCVRTQFVMSYGDPPLDTGMSSCISGEVSSLGGSVLSTFPPHNQQVLSRAYTRSRVWLRRWLFWRRGLCLGRGGVIFWHPR